MNPDDVACETNPEDHIRCFIEYLRRPDARISVEGEHWSMCFGRGDVLNAMIAIRLESTLSSGNSVTVTSNKTIIVEDDGTYEEVPRGWRPPQD